jgi:phosphoribosyl 1,2-cyclic phosphodiesterase
LPIHATEKCWQAGPARVFPNLSALSVFHPFVPGQVLNFGELTILPFAVDHGTTAPGAVGYVVLFATRKFIFTGDFLSIPNDHSPLFRGADLCFMEATNWHPAPHTGHQSVTEAIRLLRKWTPLQTYLVHYSGAEDLEHSGDAVSGPLGRAQFHSRLAKISAGQNIRLAEHGMTFEYQEEMQNLEWYRTQRA